MIKTIKNRTFQIKERFGSSLISGFLQQKSVPADGLNIKHLFGGAILFLFVLQVITGFLLQLYYVPTLKGAYKSVELIMSEVEFGWLIRSIHIWSAHFMVIFLLLHLGTAFFSRSYQSPREITWISGCTLFALILSICFFGYLLPWNERSFYSMSAGIQIIGKLPLVGSGMVHFIQGSGQFTESTLNRFSVFHTMLLPGLFFIILIFHIYLIQAHGIMEPVSWKNFTDEKLKCRLPFFPDFFRRILLFWIILANGLLLMALFFPSELGEQANRFLPAPLHTKPEWFFIFIYQTLKVIPSWLIFFPGENVALTILLVGFLFVVLLPLFDNGPAPRKTGKYARILVMVFFIYILVMSIWSFLG
jgi:cytochrome b6